MNNQALIATLSRVKAVSQLRAVALHLGCPELVQVSHDGPLVVTSGGVDPLFPAGLVERV